MGENISVIVPVYNLESYIERCVHSILAQTHRDLEIILVDDGSTDSSPRILDALAQKDERIHVIHKQNGGVTSARLAGAASATGEWIGFVDGDDDCAPDRFEKQIAFLESQDEFDIVSSEMYFFDESGIWGQNHKPEKPSAESVACGSPICHAPVMMRKKCTVFSFIPR